MKLFQSLLVAPAAIGLLSSISASATELNIKDASRYSQVASIPTFDQIYETDWAHKALSDIAKSRGCLGQIPEGNISRIEAATILNKCVTNVAQLSDQEERLISEFNSELALLNGKADELDSRLNKFEAGSFSTTTAASFSADFAIGAVDGSANSDKVSSIYGYQIDLTTSFTGEASFVVSLDAGSADGSPDPLTELDFNGTNDVLTVDGIAYTFPLGEKLTVFFGDSMDGSTLYNTACVYGGQTNTLDDCGNANSAMAAGYGSSAGASYDFGNGLTAAIGYEGQGSTDKKGLLSKEGADVFGGQLSYTTDMYGLSLTYASMETVDSNSDVVANGDTTYWGFNAYLSPDGDNLPSVSIGYETGDSETSGTAETYHWFLGVQWDDLASSGGTLGAALGTKEHTSEDADEYLMYEAFYSYPLNDSLTITPLMYVIDQPKGTDDETGFIVKASFSY